MAEKIPTVIKQHILRSEERPPPVHHRHLPRLMLPRHRHSHYGDFHSLSDENVHHQDLTQLQNKRCVGSSHGWLIMIHEDSPSITAVNPLDFSTSVHLPSLLTFPDIFDFDGEDYVCHSPLLGLRNISSRLIKNTYVKKAVFSKDPTEEGCVAMVIFGNLRKLAFCRIGDEEWTMVAQQDFVNGYEDVVFDADGWFYAVNFDGVIVSGNPMCCTFWESVYEPDSRSLADRRYLALDTKGRLLLINRYIRWKDYDHVEDEENEGEVYCDAFSYKTSRFEVCRLDDEAGRLNEIDSLEDGVLFLGDNESSCLSWMKFKECKEDSIYFSDDNLIAHEESRIGGHDLGVYDMKNGCIDKIFQCCPDDEGKGIWPPPIWVALPL